MKHKKLSIQQLTVSGVMAAVICILGPLSLPIGPVPISLTIFAIYLAVYALDTKMAFLAYVIYLLIGLIGIPVFSGFSSGPAKLFGPTGGYLFGFFFLVPITGFFIGRFRVWYMSLLGMLLGTGVCYFFGTLWLACQMSLSFGEALMAGVIPFILGDLLKMAAALFLGPILHKQLKKAGLKQ